MTPVVSRIHDLPESALLDHVIQVAALNVVFQPIIATGSGDILGHEALVRGPAGSTLEPPLRLLEVAGREGRLQELETVILRFILRRFAAQRHPGRLFVNVTPSTLLFLQDRTARFRDYLGKVGVAPEQIVMEITENEPIDDYAITREVLQAYRRLGFSFALDDVGAGYAGLRHLSELNPEYVKIERHFIENLHANARKAALIRIIETAARALQSKVIAEGVETEEEFETLRRIGVAYAQGYFIGRPEAECRREALPEVASMVRKSDETPNTGVTETVRSLLRRAPSVNGARSTNEVAEMLEREPALSCIVLVNDANEPAGLLTRQDVQACFSQNYGRALYGRKPAIELARAPLVVPADRSLEWLSRQVTEENELRGDDHFVIVDATGRYRGVGNMLDLLRRMTDLKVEAARHANPLSGLPGNVPIDRHISGLLARGEGCVLGHFDIDHFKIYNDRYGYAAGDDVLRRLGELIRSVLHEGRDFAGHVGGDDYVVVFQSADWQARCRQLLEDFDAMAPGFYSESDQSQGGFEARDRRGRKTLHRQIALSIGAVVAEPGQYELHHDLAHVASQAKSKAKSKPGSCLHVIEGMSASR